MPAFVELFDRYWQKLFTIAYARLESEDDAKDCVQEVFITIWTKKDHLNIPLSVPAYLFTAVKNRVFNVIHARLTQQQHLLSYISEVSTFQGSGQDGGVDELLMVIETEIALMPEQMRKIYRLSREENMSGQQIADHLSISHQTVRNQISTALKRIKDRVVRYQTGG